VESDYYQKQIDNFCPLRKYSKQPCDRHEKQVGYDEPYEKHEQEWETYCCPDIKEKDVVWQEFPEIITFLFLSAIGCVGHATYVGSRVVAETIAGYISDNTDTYSDPNNWA
jgi:hypothetical protein